jgi:hypothetical protein
MKKLIVCSIIIMFCMLITPVIGENITYSDDYWNTVNMSNMQVGKITDYNIGNYWNIVMVLEQHRQSMLMEKQNEILFERNRLLTEQNNLLQKMFSMKIICVDFRGIMADSPCKEFKFE